MTATTHIDSTIQRQLDMIDALDLGPIKWTLTKDNYGAPPTMTMAEATEAIEQYKMLLKLWAMYPDREIVMSRFIDEVWHTHLLDSTKYVSEMDAIFGKYIHHYPYFGVQDAVAEKRLTEAFNSSAPLFAEHFGVDIVATSQAWVRNQHYRQREYHLHHSEPVSALTMAADCGQVRCCNACNKVGTDPEMAEVMFGPRPSI